MYEEVGSATSGLRLPDAVAGAAVLGADAGADAFGGGSLDRSTI